MQKYRQQKEYHGKLLKTEKIQLYNDNNTTKAFITATYLNVVRDKNKENNVTDPLLKLFMIFKPEFPNDKKENERFIVGIYLDSEVYDELEEGSFALTLNGKKPLKIVPLERNDKRLQRLSFVSTWGDYFMVIFPPIKSEKLNLKFESDLYGTGTIRFAKRARYVYTGKAFD